jgi:hypothetical protein
VQSLKALAERFVGPVAAKEILKLQQPSLLACSSDRFVKTTIRGLTKDGFATSVQAGQRFATRKSTTAVFAAASC